MAPKSPEHRHKIRAATSDTSVEEEGEEVILLEKPPLSPAKRKEEDKIILKEATKLKEEGNAHFSNQHFGEAANSYREALRTLDGLHSPKVARDLHVSLNGNLSMVALKAHKYEEAEYHCTVVINDWDESVAKIWYRRGVARENMRKLEPALDDLKRAVRLLQQQKQNDLIKTALQALDRVHKQLVKEREDPPGAGPAPAPFPVPNGKGPMNGHHHPVPAPVPVVPRPPPPPDQQKQDVLRLLVSRSVAMKQHLRGGEALLLIDWKWWCQWCRHVDMFGQDTKTDRVLSLLPGNAIAPPKQSSSSNDDDSTDSEDDDDPGPIDNSALFLPRGRYYHHWYQHFRSETTPPALRPNLVRGFHYELLPREAYAALSQWYGEITPRILRRTKENGLQLDLYNTPSLSKPSSSQQQCTACRARGATKRCTRCMAVWYCDRTCQEAHWQHHKQPCSKISQQRKNGGGSVSLPVLDGRVGLNNLGNTCFMNSSLQCLSHATPLMRFFLSNQFLTDLNPNNPLGTGGKLAHAFELCLKELWWKNQTSTSPTALKRAIALFAPRFAGCLQHDAQEFLAYLLDGLHEDLNRIKKAPYVEMPDFDDNGVDTQVNASLAWDCHKRRNDSLILDTFYGQFKSTCVCPCGRVSVSFDAFNHVSLEIPQLQQSTVWLTFLVFGRSGANAAVQYGLGLRRGSLVADVRQALSKSFGVPPAHMVICEISEHTIVEILRDDKPISAIGQSDVITVYTVEPYTTSSIHIIASHAVVEEDSSGEPTRDLFGLPFLTSCDANLTCRQLFEHIWASVRHLVVPLTEDGKPDEDLDPDLEEVFKQLIKIRATDTEGNSLLVFPTGEDSASSNPQEEEKNEEMPQTTCYLPRYREEQIKTFLGEDCTTRFLFLSLEWTMKMDVPLEIVQKNAASSNSGGSNNKKKKKLKKNNAIKAAKMIPKTVGIQEKRFVALTQHASYHQCMKKKKELEAARGVTLDQCFETFTKPERLDEHNMWYCSNCKDHVRALKTMELWRLPNILMVHLKRFEFRHGYRRDKLSTFVDFPIEGLDMSKHCAQWTEGSSPPEQLRVNDRVPAVYDLFAVVNHFGRMGFGHYTAFARRWDEEKISSDWGLFDDSSARSVGTGRGGSGGVVDEVVSSAAYVLFYRRRQFN